MVSFVICGQFCSALVRKIENLERYPSDFEAPFVSNSRTDFDPEAAAPAAWEKPVSCGEKIHAAACARTMSSVPESAEA